MKVWQVRRTFESPKKAREVKTQGADHGLILISQVVGAAELDWVTSN